MTYEGITIRDPNPVKRWIHGRRFSDALKVLREARPGTPPRVLDFGASDGELVRRMADGPPVRAWVYEPEADALSQAKRKLAGLDWVTLADSLDGLEPGSFDYVFCLEVLEHLPAKETDEALAAIGRMMKPDGRAVIGVPLEIGLPALAKGLFRMSRRYGSFDAAPGNIARAVVGRPPAQRPAREVYPGYYYYDSHLGFDYRSLARRLADGRFEILGKWCCPLPWLGTLLNSELYYLIRKTASAPSAA